MQKKVVASFIFFGKYRNWCCILVETRMSSFDIEDVTKWIPDTWMDDQDENKDDVKDKQRIVKPKNAPKSMDKKNRRKEARRQAMEKARSQDKTMVVFQPEEPKQKNEWSAPIRRAKMSDKQHLEMFEKVLHMRDCVNRRMSAFMEMSKVSQQGKTLMIITKRSNGFCYLVKMSRIGVV